MYYLILIIRLTVCIKIANPIPTVNLLMYIAYNDQGKGTGVRGENKIDHDHK